MAETDQDTVVMMTGELTFADSARFRDMMAKIKRAGSKSILFDLKNLEFIDSAGLGLFVFLQEEMSIYGKKISLTNVRGDVERVMLLSKFHEFIKIH